MYLRTVNIILIFMEQTAFGITINSENFPPNVNIKELIALLFASPNIPVDQVERIISNPSNVKFDLLEKMTCEKISGLLEMQNRNISDLSNMYSEKIASWTKTFGVIDEEDIDYIQFKFHLKKEIFLNDIRKSICEVIESPIEFAEYVNKYIKGQKDAVKTLSIPFFNHLMRVKQKANIPKNVICLIGNTGIGKTETINRFSSVMNVPIVRINLSSVVPNGIVGNTIAKEFSAYINEESDLDLYKYAVVHFLELDKLSTKYSKDLNYGISIQKELLELFDKDGFVCLKTNKDRWDEKVIKLPVNDLLICFDGAFIGIEDVIEKRLKKEHKLSPEKFPGRNFLIQFLTKDDLIEYGILHELLSRFGKISLMNPLSVDSIYEILINGKENDISVHKSYCKERGFLLEFENDALYKLAQLTHQSDLGVRGISSILNLIMEDVYYESSIYKNQMLTIDTFFIEKRLFYDKHSKLIDDFEHGTGILALSKKYGIDEYEISELLITHTEYKNGGK